MPRSRRTFGVALLLAGLAFVLPVAPPATAAVAATPVVTGLNYPSKFTVGSDGRIFWTEWQTGLIGVFTPGTGAKTTFAQITDLCRIGEQGLFGIVLHPQYPTVADVFVYATRTVGGACTNQVLRVAPGGALTVLLSIPGPVPGHNGGRMLIGPDGFLYVSTGDGLTPANAQAPGTAKGKILRMTLTGAAPADNPTAGSVVWASGIRNVFGFDFDPATGLLWAIDNGPECNDEINLIEKGGNYGWGATATCTTPPLAPANTNRDGPSPRLPAYWYSPPDGPTGAAFCSNCGLGSAFEGRLLYGTWATGDVQALTLGSTRRTVVDRFRAFDGPANGVLDVERAPNGTMYFSDPTTIYRLASGTTPPPPTTTTTLGSSTTTTPATPAVSVPDSAGWERHDSTSSIFFTVKLDRAASQAVRVQFATSPGTATPSSDYYSLAGTLTIAAGQTSGSVRITIISDKVREQNETLFLKLSNPVNGHIVDDTALGTIINDD